MNTVSLRKTRRVVFEQHRFLGEKLVPTVTALQAKAVELDRIGNERWTATNEAHARIEALSAPLRRPLLGRLRWLLLGR